MAHVTQKTFQLEVRNGQIASDFPFVAEEITKRLTRLQKDILVEDMVGRYLLIMESPISSEGENDTRQDELYFLRRFFEHAGIHIQLIEKI